MKFALGMYLDFSGRWSTHGGNDGNDPNMVPALTFNH